MRRISTLFICLCAVVAASAANLNVLFKGQPVTSGATYQTGYTEDRWEVGAMSGVDYKINSEVTLTGQAGLSVTIEVRSLNEMPVLMCSFDGTCKPINADNGFYAKKSGALPATSAQPMDIAVDYTYEDQVPPRDTNVQITVYPTADPSQAITFEVDMLAKPASEVGGLQGVATGDYLRISGHKRLQYSVAQPTQLEMFSILGTRVVSRRINGNGMISIDNLPAGVYIYRMGSRSGKIVVK